MFFINKSKSNTIKNPCLKLVFYLFIFVFIVLLLGKGAATAATAIAIEPTRIEVTLQPGQTSTYKLRVSNRGQEPVIIDISSQAFGVKNEQYDYQFSEAEESKKWLNISQKSAEVGPNKTVSIDYQISVPATASPGGRYLAIFASAKSSKDGGAVVSRTGQLIYLTVSGAFKKDGDVLGVNVPWIVFNRNVEWSYRVRNTGSVHFYSPLNLRIFNILRRKVGEQQSDRLIMPNSTRLMTESTRLPVWPGLYTLEINAGAADKPVVSLRQTILFLPVPFILLVLLIMYWVVQLLLYLKKRHASKGFAPKQ